MTVSTSVDRADSLGNGVTTAFAVPFYFLDPTHLQVVSTNLASGAATTLVLGSDYTVSGAGVATGGTVTTTVAPAAGVRLSVLLNMPVVQATHYVPNDPFPAASHEAALDYLTLLVKQALETAGRSIYLPPGEGTFATQLASAVARAGMLLGFDATGAPMLSATAASAAIGFTSETQTASAGQTVFTLATTSYTPGGSNIAVFIDGLFVTDYVQTNGTTVTFTGVTFTGVEQITFLCGRLVGVAANAANVAVQQAGTGTAIRTVGARAADSRTLNDYTGVDNTGINDSTGSFVNFKTDVQVVNFAQSVSGGRDVMAIDAGVFEISAQTFSHMQKIKGKGRKNTFLKLKPGETGSMFNFTAENVAGTSLDDTNHCVVEGITFIGNRVDSTTTGTSSAILCPDAPFSLGTQYAPSIQMRDVEIFGFTGDGIWLGGNRNWALMDEVIVRYCNGHALTSYGYDHRINKSDFGQCVLGTGLNFQAGGSHDLSGCNVYGNLINLAVTAFVNSYVNLRGCAFDAALHDGALIAAGSGPVTFLGGRFYSSGQATDNTYADIHTAGEINVIGTQFVNGATGKRPRLTLQTDATSPKVLWLPTYIDMSGGAATPFATALVDDFTVLRYSGASDEHWGSAGAATLSAYVGATERVRIDANGLSTNNAALLISALTSLTSHNAAQTATMTNAPVAGNPTKWVAINDGATTRYIPCW